MVRVAATLLFAASLLAAQAQSPVASPACALLNSEEVAGVLGKGVVVADGGPEMAGSSLCQWTAKEAVMGLMVLRPAAFGAGGAEEYFDLTVAGAAHAGEAAEMLPGIGARAALLADTAGGVRLTIMVLTGDAVLTLTAANVPREAALALAGLAAGRM